MKTVYVLGAGFTKPANSLLQSEIIAAILSLNPSDFIPNEAKVQHYLEEFRKFLDIGLYMDPVEFKNVPLEDVFTPIDRCILDGISFHSYDRTDLFELREKIYALIILAVKEKLGASPKDYVDTFAQYLVGQMQKRLPSDPNYDPHHDPVAVLSTNWDILLDNSIKAAVHFDNDNGVVDYCCYISSLDPDDTIMPGLLALGKGKYNVKLLKLHGSMNWLNCPKCQRLYVAFDRKIAESGIYGDKNCPHCRDNFIHEPKDSSILKHNLIMPTFLKDLNNFQIKLIWQNAGIELSEASKVVFIGYSLPQADFELRQLLSRMIPHEASIDVVMREETDPSHTSENNDTLLRYKTFFGKRSVKGIRLGVVKYVATL